MGNPRSWRIGTALVGAVAAGALALWLIFTAESDRGGPARDAVAAPPVVVATTPAEPTVGASPETAATLTSPAPRVSASPLRPRESPSPGPAPNPTSVVDEFERRLAEATAGGLVRRDVALDLRNAITALRQRIDLGSSGGGLHDSVAGLRKKLAERLAEKAIEPRTADQLLALLALLG